jgi:hypothetical protein
MLPLTLSFSLKDLSAIFVEISVIAGKITRFQKADDYTPCRGNLRKDILQEALVSVLQLS